MNGSRVPLPPGAGPPIRVFVNGVPQLEGRDYAFAEGKLVFDRELKRERLSIWRWTLMFFSIAGSYGHDTVDVQYRVGGRGVAATNLDIAAPGPPSG